MDNAPLKILLVEDNPGDMVLLRETLREMTVANYQMTHVGTLSEAEIKLKKHPYDVVLLDLNLPDGSGLTNIARITGIAKDIPIIVLTGLKDELLAVDAVRKGAQDFLIKGDIHPDLFWRSMRYAVERKRIEEKLQKALKQAEAATKTKSEFLAHISHELRTPLNIILGMAELLYDSNLTARQNEYVRLFKTSGETLLFLINDLLDLSKIEAGKMHIEQVPYDLHTLVTDILQFMKITAQKRLNKLDLHIDQDVPKYIKGDPQRLRQVIFNLVGNAIKFTYDGSIALSLSLSGTSDPPSPIHFNIVDTGIGIPPNKLNSIFDAFSQADSSTARKYGGTGLGLTICRKLVELMGGTLTVNSHEGRGSTFTFSLNHYEVSSEEALNTPIKSNDARSEKDSLQSFSNENPGRILIVDDSYDNRYLIKAFLSGFPCHFDEANNGKEALSLFQRQNYNLVIMDMQMPEMDGFDCCKFIRKFEGARKSEKKVPILALTAFSREEDKEKCLAVGCNQYLMKPVEKGQLLTTVLEMIQNPVENQGSMQNHSRAPVINIPEALKDLIPSYLNKKFIDIALLRAALQKRDMKTIQTIGHQMKGTGKPYGFPGLSQIGGDLEAAAIQIDDNRVELAIGSLVSYLEKVKSLT